MANLPPQAYTRETLMIAYDWLQKQSSEVQKLARTPDLLVGLYLQAQRKKTLSMEQDAPVSTQLFKEDLKRLSKGLEAFATTSATVVPSTAAVTTMVLASSPQREATAKWLNQNPEETPENYPQQCQTGAASLAITALSEPSYALVSNNSPTVSNSALRGRATGMSDSRYQQYYGNTAQPITYNTQAVPPNGPHSQALGYGSAPYPHGPYETGAYAQSGAAALALDPGPLAYGQAIGQGQHHSPPPFSSAVQAVPLVTPGHPAAANLEENPEANRSYANSQARPQMRRTSAVERMQQARREAQAQKNAFASTNAHQPLPWNQPAQARSTYAHSPTPAVHNATVAGMLSLFDDKTQEAIRSVTRELNLGSEKEALRLLVSLGYKRVRPLLENIGEELENLNLPR